MTTLSKLREELSDPNASPMFKYVSAIRAYRDAIRSLDDENYAQNKYDSLILLSSAVEGYRNHLSGSSNSFQSLPTITNETESLISHVLSHPKKKQLILDALNGSGAMDQPLMELIDGYANETMYHSGPQHSDSLHDDLVLDTTVSSKTKSSSLSWSGFANLVDGRLC